MAPGGRSSSNLAAIGLGHYRKLAGAATIGRIPCRIRGLRGPGAHAGLASLGERGLPEPRRPHGHAGVPGGDGGAARPRPHPHPRRPVRRGGLVALPPAHPGPFRGLRPPLRFVRQRPAPARLALHAQPLRRGLQQRHIAFAPLASGQQLGRFGGRHPEGGADAGGRGDAPVLQLRPIVTRRRRVVSRSCIRARRSAGESLGFAGGDRGGSRSSMGEPLGGAAGPVWIRGDSLRLPDPVRHQRLAPPSARRPASRTYARNSAWMPRRQPPSRDGAGDPGLLQADQGRTGLGRRRGRHSGPGQQSRRDVPLAAIIGDNRDRLPVVARQQAFHGAARTRPGPRS